MKIFLLGSLAFDTLGHYEGHFRHLFSPELLENLSVSFVLARSSRHFGGCAGNVAYSLGLLEVPATVCGVLGFDGARYLNTMESWGMDTHSVEQGKAASAQAVIGTDLDGKQISQFIPGVWEEAGAFRLPEEATAGDLLLVGPERPDRMLDAARQAAKRGLRVLADPGQLLHVFSGKELLELLTCSEGILVNAYEWALLQEKTGLSSRELQSRVKWIVVTLAEEGARLYLEEDVQDFPAVPAQVLDPTGAGDAFRAGVLAGLSWGWPLADAIKVGVHLGAACVEAAQAQGHHLSEDQVLALKKLGSA